jgi:hypothetical protein
MLLRGRGLSRRFHGFEGHRDAEIQCMFWCMLAFDIAADCCDFLQNCTGGQVFHSVNVMRTRALACGLLQHSRFWTQNPPPSLAYEFDSRSRHHYNQQLIARSIPDANRRTLKSADHCKSWRFDPFPGINIKLSSSIN